jgi:hypothetical protein
MCFHNYVQGVKFFGLWICYIFSGLNLFLSHINYVETGHIHSVYTI